MINDLEQTSAKLIDNVSIFDTNNDSNLQSPTLLEIFNSQLIKTVLTQGINHIL